MIVDYVAERLPIFEISLLRAVIPPSWSCVISFSDGQSEIYAQEQTPAKALFAACEEAMTRVVSDKLR